jgi:plastocyanin
MQSGASFPIKAELADSNGHVIVIPNTPAATFSVADTTIAHVGTDGVLSAERPGNTTLSVGMTWNGITRSSKGTVAVSAYRVVDTVTMTAQKFQPDSLDIGRWGAVVFLNSSGVTHNVTFTSTTPTPPANIPDNANALDARVFTEPGRYTYQCTHHPGMTGVIRVH